MERFTVTVREHDYLARKKEYQGFWENRGAIYLGSVSKNGIVTMEFGVKDNESPMKTLMLSWKE